MDERINENCAICLSRAPLLQSETVSIDGLVTRSCPRCGNYRITLQANAQLLVQLGPADSPLRLRASYWMNRYPNSEVTTDQLRVFKGLEDPPLGERFEAILDLVRRKANGHIGKEIGVHPPRFLGASCSVDESELNELLRYLKDSEWLARGSKPQNIKLTAKGLERLQKGDTVEQKASITISNSNLYGSPIAAGQGVEQTVGDITVTANDHQVLQTLAEAIQAADAPQHEKDDAILAVEKIGQAKDVAQVRRWYDHLKVIDSVVKAIPSPVWTAAVEVFQRLLGG